MACPDSSKLQFLVTHKSACYCSSEFFDRLILSSLTFWIIFSAQVNHSCLSRDTLCGAHLSTLLN